MVPIAIVSGRQYFVAGGGNGSAIDALEASSYYPLNGRLALVPACDASFNVNNFDRTPKLNVGNRRASCHF
ncbi:hypothetical protein H6F86_09880 [Phormidium sp. FACHB-592]|uniref:Uncharacterized protein n=1 Tax=Stenomitos frigidus AS-A4 TaxID=2933935 RepID=A0ABV0KRU0_9CYAN|nr:MULTISPECIES: hypothetical protein [Cyanophyceae]MBD2037717.1 hypothetical protein [Leptolyngbya sp. FACHB-321]MBD2074195.1 hypothetical protein [Phormidium sp. FACHB-592]